jgi:hypothetical protein
VLANECVLEQLDYILIDSIFCGETFRPCEEKPLSCAICSTGNEKVRPRGIACNSISKVLGLDGDYGGFVFEVRKASAELAR